MANQFHIVFTPGTAINLSTDTLTIAFDKPKEADPVTVTLTEVDAWVSDGNKIQEPGGGPGVLIAEFTGKIVGGKFVGALTKSAPGTSGVPALKVLFDGQAAGAVQALPIPAATVANENGIFEVQVKVAGTINKKPSTFTAPSPVFVRNFKTGRPVVAFVTGSGGGFFTVADAFMRNYADATFDRNNVLDIREFLRTQAGAQGFGPWGEVNIVSHGNAVEWVIKIVNADANARHLRRWNVEDATKQAAFQPSITSQLDASSTLVIRGCAIGNDQGLLDQVRILFGGQVKVLAPKFLQEYDTFTGTPREAFFEFFFFYSIQPATTGGPAVAPSDAVCVTTLKKKFPGPVPPVSDADWLRMLGTRVFAANGFRASDGTGAADRTETITWRQALTVNHTPDRKQDAVNAALALDWRGKAQTNFDAADVRENLEIKFADWNFVEGSLEQKPAPGGTRFSKLFTGTRVRIEVRRELRDASGTPVKPTLTNPAHYGSSP